MSTKLREFTLFGTLIGSASLIFWQEKKKNELKEELSKMKKFQQEVIELRQRLERLEMKRKKDASTLLRAGVFLGFIVTGGAFILFSLDKQF